MSYYVICLKVTNVRLSDKILSDTDKLAKKYGITRSEIMRQALTLHLHLVENVGVMLRPIAFQVKPGQLEYIRRGDVVILRIPTGHALVVGSTSSGAVGPKSLDKVKVAGRVVGKFLARVALMDVAATGAFPVMLSATLSVEKEPSGSEIVDGIRNEVRILGLEPDQVLLENTEENFKIEQTGAGLTVIGFANDEELRIGKTLPGDFVVAIGKPKVGEEVLPAEAKGEIADLRNVLWLSQKKYVHDMKPVGDFGIAHEARMMAHAVGRQLKLGDETNINLEKSAGPATVLLVTLNPEKFDDLSSLIQKPVSIIGEII